MTGPTLIRRAGGQGPRQEYRQAAEESLAEEQPAVLPRSRRVWFEIPEGFMASISLVPYTEPPPEPAGEPEAEGD